MNRATVNGGASSYEASPTQQTELEPVQIVFTEEEQAEIRTEISRLSMLSVICQVVGARPNRGEMKDLLQAAYAKDIGRVADVQFLGKGFYHVELESSDAVLRGLDLSPLDLRVAKALIRHWDKVFIMPMKKIHLTLVFLGIRKEFIGMVSRIGARFCVPIEKLAMMETRLLKTVVDRMEKIPKRE